MVAEVGGMWTDIKICLQKKYMRLQKKKWQYV